METHPVLAWVPSITSVSRQAIFSGRPPFNFADSVTTTNREHSKWQGYWVDQGYRKTDIFYQRSLGSDGYSQTNLLEMIVNKKVIGCVIDSIDKFMHSAQQGLWSVQSELEHWLEKDFLRLFLDDLIQNHFEVFITADHGNVETVGVGRINQGVLANSKGERVRIYDDKSIRKRTEMDYVEVCRIWDSNFLPRKFYPLIATENFAFIQKNDKIVSHGGTHIEELYVPFVKVSK
ncbi:MAG: BREX-3 system phosphatase PglZ, partial [Enterococcus hulanensis]